MSYSKFKKIQEVVESFNLDAISIRLFENVNLTEPSEWLIETLNRAESSALRNDKTKSERVISPLLTEVVQRYADRVSFFSGEQLNISTENNLSGECDFFFALQPPKMYFESPIIILIRTKKIAQDEDKSYGLTQCAAQMLGAKYFNDEKNKSVPFIFGCATDGIEWQFLKLENDIYYVDNKIYSDLKEILGAWHHVINLFL